MNQPRIAVIDLPGLPYDGTTLEKRGLGGSESCVIYLTRELAQLGFEPTVFCRCDEDDNRPGEYNGVTFRPLREAQNSTEKFDVVVVSRTVQPFMEKAYQSILDTAGWRMLWMHDTFLWGDKFMEDLVVQGKINEIMTLSDWHTTYVLNCNHEKKRNYEMLKNRTYVIRNCMGNYVDEVDISRKDRDQFVYNASVSKGMVVLLEHVWPRIREQIPTAKLKIIGGFYRFPERHGPDEQERKWMQLRDDNDGRNGVEFTGVIPQRQIAEILAGASWFLYPTEFPETFGISTLEAQAYNCVPLTARFGALEEVALDSTSYKLDYSVTPNVIFPNINRDQQVERFVSMVVNAYRNPYVWQQKAYAGNALRDIIGWDTMAVQFKQHIYRKLGWYLPVEEQRRAIWISNRVKQLTGRRTGNPEDHAEPKSSRERHIAVISPFRNAQRWLRDHMWSVAAQNYENYTHYLIDDVSDDGSQEVIRETMRELGEDRASKIVLVCNKERKGAVANQITAIREHVTDPEAIVTLLDGDDFLVNLPDVFDRINNLHERGKEFTYGSCWSMVDDIPLVAQPYPRAVREARAYRQHRFNWGIPYTHLRTFRRRLLDGVDDSVFKHENGEWFGAGGDVATFYNIIEQVQDPDAVHAVPDILVNYNDTNPDNDYKINAEEQNRTAEAIRKQSKETEMSDIKPISTSLADRQAQKKIRPLNNKRILIAIPTARYIEPETFKSIYNLDVPEGYTTEFQFFYGYNIAQIRNLIAHWVVKGGYDYLFSVDSDIVLPRDSLRKMIEADKDMVSGLYIQRIPDTHTVEIYGVTRGGGRANIPYDLLKGKGLVEVAGCGFGCVLIKRRVFEGIEYPHFEYHNALTHKDTVSEDVDFCMKATKAGFTIWADTSIHCDHLGNATYRVEK